MIEGALSRLELLHYFEGIITSPEVGSSKENPDIFEQAIQLLGHLRKIQYCSKMDFMPSLQQLISGCRSSVFTMPLALQINQK